MYGTQGKLTDMSCFYTVVVKIKNNINELIINYLSFRYITILKTRMKNEMEMK